jgi:hypothetical protein
MESSRRSSRRDGKRPERTSNKIRPSKVGVPTDDSPLALLRAQLERVDAQRAALESVLGEEKDARAREARELGEMMARVSLAEGRVHAAQVAAEDLAAQLEEERRLASEREARQALLRNELESLRSEARRLRTDAPPPRTLPTGAPADAEGVRRELEAARAEASRMRASLEAFHRRVASIRTRLKEMGELMADSATLFDELEEDSSASIHPRRER